MTTRAKQASSVAYFRESEADVQAARDAPAVQPPSRNHQVHRHATYKPKGQRANYPDTSRHRRRPQPHGPARPPPLLGRRRPRLAPLPLDRASVRLRLRRRYTYSALGRAAPGARKGRLFRLVRGRAKLSGQEIRAGGVRGDHGGFVPDPSRAAGTEEEGDAGKGEEEGSGCC